MNLNPGQYCNVGKICVRALPPPTFTSLRQTPALSCWKLVFVVWVLFQKFTDLVLCMAAASLHTSHPTIRKHFIERIELQNLAPQNKPTVTSPKDSAFSLSPWNIWFCLLLNAQLAREKIILGERVLPLLCCLERPLSPEHSYSKLITQVAWLSVPLGKLQDLGALGCAARAPCDSSLPGFPIMPCKVYSDISLNGL